MAPTLDGLGYELVRLTLAGKHQATLQILAERRDRVSMSVEDCERISRALSAKLDVEDPIAGAYTLEVSSPGIDRPLVKPEDFRRFVGYVAKLETKLPRDGQRRFTGRIARADEAAVTLALEEGEARAVTFGFAELNKAKLVLTDELLKAARKAAEERRA